jgi:hypothetical protein
MAIAPQSWRMVSEKAAEIFAPPAPLGVKAMESFSFG